MKRGYYKRPLRAPDKIIISIVYQDSPALSGPPFPLKVFSSPRPPSLRKKRGERDLNKSSKVNAQALRYNIRGGVLIYFISLLYFM